MHTRILSILCLAALGAEGQSFTGRIVGTVTDSSGGVISAAQVKAINAGTNRTVLAASNVDGNYAFNELPRGEYTVEVSAQSFKNSVRKGILLAIGQHARVDVQLEVGSVAESVEVVADASLLETVDSVVGKVVDNKRITELPLNSRNVFSLLYLTPGVTGSVSSTYSTGFAINGALNDRIVFGIADDLKGCRRLDHVGGTADLF